MSSRHRWTPSTEGTTDPPPGAEGLAGGGQPTVTRKCGLRKHAQVLHTIGEAVWPDRVPPPGIRAVGGGVLGRHVPRVLEDPRRGVLPPPAVPVRRRVP